MDYYIDTESGSDETGDGTKENPLASVQAVLDRHSGVSTPHIQFMNEMVKEVELRPNHPVAILRRVLKAWDEAHEKMSYDDTIHQHFHESGVMQEVRDFFDAKCQVIYNNTVEYFP